MKQNTDFKTTEAMIIEKGYSQLSGKELKERISEKTISGDYYNGRKYIIFIDKDGNMEGENDLGSHRFGKCFIDTNNNTITTKWESGWENWTGRAYDVDGEIKLYDTTTLKWRTTFKTFEEGKKTLRVKN
jgi:hypothetical protein